MSSGFHLCVHITLKGGRPIKINGNRQGLSLIEILVVIAILAVMIGLLLPAVQMARDAAARSRSQNNQRQIALAMHSYASANNGELPRGVYEESRQTLYTKILPFLEIAVSDSNSAVFAKAFYNAADPSYAVVSSSTPERFGFCNYPANGVLFKWDTTPHLQRSIPDGLSNTLLLGECYARCENIARLLGRPGAFSLDVTALFGIDLITAGNPPRSTPRYPGRTFQIRPTLTTEVGDAAKIPNGCDQTLSQTPHASGMLVALADGSCRILAPSISEETYCGLLTPDRFDTIGTDW